MNHRGRSYWAAAECTRGHAIHSQLNRGIEVQDKFCGQCGAPVIYSCPNCETPIRGELMQTDAVILFWAPDSYCTSCGAAMPWLESKLDALREIAMEDAGASSDEADGLVEAAIVLAQSSVSAETEVAVSRLRRFAQRAGGKSEDALWAVITSVASEAAKGRLN
jgi:hypothetical protein